MQIKTAKHGASYFIWDTDRLTEARDCHFEPDWWADQKRVSGQADGRGNTLFIAAPKGPCVLRHYRRGGLAQKFSSDRYLWLGRERSRAFAEWRLLETLVRLDLPVPTPIAARVTRQVISYRADLITARIEGAYPLAQALQQDRLTATAWQALGRTIARLHAAGVDHHDLNAHNILVDDDATFHLVDFDRGRLRKPGPWRERNLARLRRSLEKLMNASSAIYFNAGDWAALRSGYLG